MIDLRPMSTTVGRGKYILEESEVRDLLDSVVTIWPRTWPRQHQKQVYQQLQIDGGFEDRMITAIDRMNEVLAWRNRKGAKRR